MAELRERGLLGELLAEFAGTLILILFGVGVVAQVVAGPIGNHDSIAWSWGIGVVLGVYVAALSGGHINPAVSVAFAVVGEFPWRKVLPYSLAQTAGAFVAALLVRWNYSEVLAAADPGHTIKTQLVFSTLPGNGTLPVGELGALRDQIIGTAILLFVVAALVDARNRSRPMANMAPFIIGLLVVGIGMAWGTDAGYAINPARDFGPRLASFLTGYHTAFSDQYGNLYFWVPIVGPLVGGALGIVLYKVLVSRYLPAVEPTPTETGTRAPYESA